MVVERCDDCPLYGLEWARSHSTAGRLLDRVLHLDFLAANFKIPWNEVTAEEVTALRILREERDQYQREQAAQNTPGE
jgi:hypothetical protein